MMGLYQKFEILTKLQPGEEVVAQYVRGQRLRVGLSGRIRIWRGWLRNQAARRRRGEERLDNRRLYRLSGYHYRADEGRLVLELGDTSYAEFLATRQVGLATWSKSEWANPLGVVAVVITSDNKILINERTGGKTDKEIGRFGLFGGYVVRDETPADDENFWAKAVQKKVEADLGRATPLRFECLGLVCGHGQSELVSWGRSGQSSEDIVAARSKGNGAKQILIENSERELWWFLLQSGGSMIGTGQAGLLTYGWRFFGLEWFDDIMRRLNLHSGKVGVE